MMGIISLIAGIAAVICVLISKLKLYALVLAAAAIILGILAKVNLGWVGLISGVIVIILFFVLSKAEKAIP